MGADESRPTRPSTPPPDVKETRNGHEMLRVFLSVCDGNITSWDIKGHRALQSLRIKEYIPDKEPQNFRDEKKGAKVQEVPDETVVYMENDTYIYTHASIDKIWRNSDCINPFISYCLVPSEFGGQRHPLNWHKWRRTRIVHRNQQQRIMKWLVQMVEHWYRHVPSRLKPTVFYESSMETNEWSENDCKLKCQLRFFVKSKSGDDDDFKSVRPELNEIALILNALYQTSKN